MPVGKRKRLAILFFVLMLLHMALIFALSCQNGQQSGETSGKVVQVAAQLVVPGYNQMEEAEQEQVKEKMQYPVRKLGHFSEYALLGIWALLFFTYLPGRHPFCFAWALSIAYAAGDEFHQSFVDGRGPAVTDVLIDSSGALAGILLVLLLLHLLHKKSSAG